MTRNRLVYLFGPVDSCPDPIPGWVEWAKHVLGAHATVFDPRAAFSCSLPGQEVVEVNEFVVDHASLLFGVWVSGSVGSCREVERALIRGIPIIAMIPPPTLADVPAKSPYYSDERVHFFYTGGDAVRRDDVRRALLYAVNVLEGRS